MKALPQSGIAKTYRPIGPSLCVNGYQNSGVRRPRLFSVTYVAVIIPPEVTENNAANGYADNAEAETELFSPQAVVADYQYALRFYRSLKQQVGSWQSTFAKTHGRQPTAADAEQQHGHEFALLYCSLLEVRTRLLVDLPRIKARLSEGQDAGGRAQHPHPKRGGERGSVNANSRAPGSVNVAADPHQQVDSVSTWLRADRYRRQRAVTAAAAARGGVPATTAAPQSRPQSNSPALAGSAPTDTVSPGPVMSQGEPFIQSAGLDAGLRGQPAAASAAAGGAGLGQEQERAPYQPVIQLTPLSHRPLDVAGAAQPGRAHGDALSPAEHLAVTADGDAGTGVSSGSELELEDSRFAAEPRWAPSGQQQQPVQQQGASGGVAAWVGSQGGVTEISSGALAHGAADIGGAVAAVAVVGPPCTAAAMQRARVAPGSHTSRLAEDASLSGDSRAKNALLAAVKYKRSGRPVGSSPQARTGSRAEGPDGHWEEGRATSPGSAAGDAEAGEGGAAATAVVGEVLRGNAVGAYAGRNRRADALPESFMVCP